MAKGNASIIVDAPLAKAWAVARDFAQGHAWIPGVSGCTIEDGGPGDRVGCVRVVTLDGGMTLAETLLAMSDVSQSVTYSPQPPEGSPLKSMVTTLSLRAITDGDKTFAEFTFDAEPLPEQDIAAMFEDLRQERYPAMLRAFKSFVEQAG